ncbi:MAG: 4-hydroxythreonine-4-phosphate dehydrogenase PdxA [Nitrospiraceae bacterium]|nr:4-hydroxythreonine-4-phosphate dehydrogenase PdxA [Nitrospiraceae bacterium]
MSVRKRLAITMGDPGGVGPEIIVRALLSPEVRGCCRPVVIGDAVVMEEALGLLGRPLKLRIIAAPDESAESAETIDLIDAGSLKAFEKGRPTAEGGAACAGYIRKAVELATAGKVDGIVTAPISKEALKMAGLKWPGHTEMLAELTSTEDFGMMLTGGPLRVLLVTIHTALRSVPDMITRSRVLKTIRLAERACDMLGIAKPRIGVAGLNPHAGEAGIFGDEEIREIVPAVGDARKEGIAVSGPFPPDTVFHKAYRAAFDIVVCMYHDQGLIPLKMIAFDTGVNVTVGLPFVRTSPDHGTAYDIAWKGIAGPASIIEAVRLAARLKI